MVTVMRIAGPLLTWPRASKYRARQTYSVPVVGVLHGMIAAAAGVRRSEARPAWITGLKMAVRIEKSGSILHDFHTINPPDTNRYTNLTSGDADKVRTVVNADGSRHSNPVITERYYVQDEEVILFIDDPLGQAHNALSRPVFALYAGRKSCPLSFPIILDSFDGSVERALLEYPTTSKSSVLDAILLFPPDGLTVTAEYVHQDLQTGYVAESYGPQRYYGAKVTPPKLPRPTWLVQG